MNGTYLTNIKMIFPALLVALGCLGTAGAAEGARTFLSAERGTPADADKNVRAPTSGSWKVSVDFSRPLGTVRPLHGINKGPLATGGTIDLTARLRELAAPLTRLHDCQWPYPEVVDVHAIFRNPEADPAQAENYDFALTDQYLNAVGKTGARIVYRLGESIEHAPVKRFVRVPRDPERWAAVCLGIIRHCNEGWANGASRNIRYWEIWNEPENRPTMWDGSDEDYFRLYRAAARAIKKHDPALKVGGPALGYSGRFEAGRFVPSAFVTNFLALCRSESLPLDFFSWHCYTADPAELTARARAIRQLLDENGFTKTESHLNEWNYLPGNDWSGLSFTTAPEARQAWSEAMVGPAGAAFVTTALIELQDAPLDVANFYHGELGIFGLFNEYGVPNRVFYALRAFGTLAGLPQRFEARGGIPGKRAVLAAGQPDRSRGAVLIGNCETSASEAVVETAGLAEGIEYEVWLTDPGQTWRKMGQGRVLPGPEPLAIRFSGPGVALVRLGAGWER